MVWPDVSCFLVNLSPDHIYPSGFFFQYNKLCKTCPRIWQVSRPIDIPIILDAFLLLKIQIRICSSGYVNVLRWNREWFFSRRVKFDSGFNVIALYEVSWHGPKIIYRFTDIRKWIMKWWTWKPFWFSKKVKITFSSNWSLRIKMDVLRSWSPPRVLIRPSAIGKISLPFSFGNISLFEQISDASIVSNSSRSATSTSPSEIQHIRRKIPLRLSFQIDGFLTDPSQL